MKWIILLIISTVLTLIYGSRGPLVSVLWYFLLYLFLSREKFDLKKAVLILGSTLLISILIYFDILYRIINYLYINQGIHTYALAKYWEMLRQGLWASSSGRDVIYDILWGVIKNNLIFGAGIGFSQELIGGTAHNIFLQIMLESGLLGLSFWVVLWAKALSRFIRLPNYEKQNFAPIVIILLSIAFGRLSFSSDYWLRPEYWFTLSFLLNIRSQGKFPREDKSNDIFL